ncbi:MAG: hypothetical protein A2X08_07135 [Bacteroidetes bacterium GWA2_32_17]|nr:MAG: hypothetical protein A2X08_07135 [Bacteroidetes bacterium GWA2_32_17]
MLKCFYILFLLVVLLNKAYTQEPDIPLLDSVSVADPLTGSVYISWFPCDSTDVAKYVIFRKMSNGNWDSIATVMIPSTFYIDNIYVPLAASNYHPELYRILAIDSAGFRSPMTLTSPIDMHHNTIYVFPYLDSVNCKMAIKLKWNKYVYWSENVNHYTIYVNINSTTWDSLSSVDGNSSEFYHQSITDNTYYCYFIRAVSNSGRTSTSNQTCFYTNLPDFPSFINADYASVTTAQRIEISFTLDTSAIVKKNYILYRSDSEFGSYLQIASYNNYTALNLIYTDNVDITKNWYYKLAAIDQCGNTVLESNIARNITVNATSNDDLTEFIKWDAYFNWLGGVETYNMYRIVDDSSPMLISSTVIDTFFTDDVSDYAVNRTGVSGKFCYYIEAIETDSNPYGIKGKSNSNVVCLAQPPIVYIPNSFTPNGDAINSEFLPIVSFVSSEKYQFKIFDRWGFKIFETNNPLKGWNGKINGRKVPAGTYVYKLSYLEANNEIKEKTGLVYLFYP